MSMIQVNLMHIFVIGPLLTYIGYKKENTEEIYFNALGAITLLLPFIVRLPFKKDYHSIINSLHYFPYILFFLYIAYQKCNIPYKWIYSFLLVTGIIVISVHFGILIYKIFKMEKEKEKDKDEEKDEDKDDNYIIANKTAQLSLNIIIPSIIILIIYYILYSNQINIIRKCNR